MDRDNPPSGPKAETIRFDAIKNDNKAVPGGRRDLQSVPSAPDLKAAIRRARLEEAERATAVAELRETEAVRLEILAEALEPVFAQVPDHVDIFDAGVVPGARPRLYIDMIGFVEMAEDRRTYQLVQNTRHGRVISARSEKLDVISQAVADYIARRLIEREKALASDTFVEDAVRAAAAPKVVTLASSGADKAAAGQGPVAAVQPEVTATTATADPPVSRRRPLFEFLMFVAEFIGFAVLIILLFAAGYFLWNLAEAWWVANYAKAQ